MIEEKARFKVNIKILLILILAAVAIIAIIVLTIFNSDDHKVNYKQEGVNTPALEQGMTAVVYNDETATWDEADLMTDWYNYGSNDKRWANAITEDGSMWVWIPRYEYQIVPDSGTIGASPNGKIKINFIGTTKTTASKDYVIHPAFTEDINNGGWSSEQDGIWVAKFEMSMIDAGKNIVIENNTVGNVALSNSVKMTSKPGLVSWNWINVANCYYNSLNYDANIGIDTNYDSHLMKNSEWGAVAYLSHSSYGIGNNKIRTNNSGFTGGGEKDSYLKNKSQSSTGTVYGIYDLSGGLYEAVAVFNNSYNGHLSGYNKTKYNDYTDASYLPSAINGTTHFASYNGISTKYATAYTNTTNKGTITSNIYKAGDATYEVYTGSSWNAWNNDFSLLVSSYFPLLYRGGDASTNNTSGLFYSSYWSGIYDSNISFRVVLSTL
ncbi:MAG: hypothetical protein PHQ89_02480 [Bacilli bacterium]|nr:hypothetical protein [Bacilli bacterium]